MNDDFEKYKEEHAIAMKEMEERLAEIDNDEDEYGDDDDSSIDDSEKYDEFDIDGVDGDLLGDGKSSGKDDGSAGSNKESPPKEEEVKVQ